MKTFLALAALLSLALASPIADSAPDTRPCVCEPPICALGLEVECECKNAAAQQCYESWIAQGKQCPEPVPSICDIPEGPPCGGFAGTECEGRLTCVDVPGDGCDPEKGGADCMGVCVAIA
ncbi:hypothetical protein EJ04DRAFT_563556 [Polyplosphaeria fusca]|uniref:Uncharacterized protein n=1 Tax=Polyplosphaeria fusca TaxID=682080 RepID=A0A9P4R2C6_9PLEO|nr:hypothetical protein EJ04DRAFT_563556 [Polyplosphaeria fusca]